MSGKHRDETTQDVLKPKGRVYRAAAGRPKADRSKGSVFRSENASKPAGTDLPARDANIREW